MVLYPVISLLDDSASGGRGCPPHTGTVPAFQSIERKQRQDASEWWLVAQPDHAALAGDLAARIVSAEFPRLDAEVVQAIAAHDDGWAAFDGAAKLNGRERPLSFLEMAPRDFLRAWHDSIERAEQVAPIGGILVSEHFCRLGRWRLELAEDKPEETQLVRDFLASEAERQQQLSRQQHRRTEEILGLVDALQFCDLLSLYLCCGAQDSVEFPQKFSGRAICLRHEGELCRMQPPLFGRGVSLAVQARRYPAAESSSISIPVLLG
jgi:hypothetical protein